MFRFRTLQFYVLILILFTLNLGTVTSDGFYKVIGPRDVRPNSEFHVAVSTHMTSVPTTITVAVVCTSLRGKAFSVEDSATVLPFSTNNIRLKIDDIDEGVCKLVSQGKGGIEFQSTTNLNYVKKSYSVFIQTDKSIYNPGQKILFRALILNSDLKPALEIRNEPISVYITDDKGHKVKEWRRVVPRGVFSEELQLSPHPNLGHWNISVQIKDQVYNKTIELAEYVYPKLLIHIDAPKHLTFEQNVLTANIKASYKSGKKVQGDATITVYPTINSVVIQPIFQSPVRKVYPIDGSLIVNFDITKELKLSDEYERTVVIDVIIEEALTGRRQNHSVAVFVHKYDYKMELIKTANYFKPGMIYTSYIKVSNHDGTPLSKERRSVTLRYGFSRLDEIYTKKKIVLDSKGLFKIELETPRNANNETALRLEAEYYDLKERLPPVPAAVSFSNNYMQIIIESERNIVNQDVEVLVNCTENMKYISYVLMGRGDVVIANSMKVDNLREFRFHFTATHAMVPVSHLLVSYVRNDGEMVADSIDVHIEGITQNFIDIQTNTFETSPGTDVDLTIRSQPNSYIGLMAIDDKVNFIKDHHDILLRDVENELNLYDPADISPYTKVLKDRKSDYFWKQGSSNGWDMFYFSGANLITNSFVTSRRPTLDDIYLRIVNYDSSTVKPDRGVGLSLFSSVTRPPLEGPYAFSRIPKPVWNKPKLYLMDELADTWLFNNFSSGFGGETSIRRRIPNTLNTWSITGFSLNPLHGLGLIRIPRKIKVSKLLSISMERPNDIQRGETLQIVVVVQNHMNKDINAEVILFNPEQMFEFVETSNEVSGIVQKVDISRRKQIPIKKYNTASVEFLITPRRIGMLELKATVNSQSNQDTVIEMLKVKAEGETLHFTKTLLIDLTKSNTFKGNLSIEIPKNVVPDSEDINVSVVGDFIGPILMNLNDLIRLPTATAEQNLVHFVPDLITLKYLQNIQSLTPTIEKEAVQNMESSYQQQLMYRTKDGGFSIYGKDDEIASLWVTAYTAMSLHAAKNYIFVDKQVISSAFEFLAKSQNLNGSFFERSAIIHRSVQSRDENSLPLTAFITLAFMEFDHPESMYSNTINKALDYIARNLDEDDSEYSVAICAYVLHLANHPSKLSAFNLLDSKAQIKNNTKWWGEKVPKKNEKSPWNSRPKSIDIEATSYGLLTMLEANLIDDIPPVLNWLIDQRNNLGGFASSQDTRIGLYAIYKVALKLGYSSNCQIEFAYKKQEVRRFNINRDSALIVQKAQLGNNARLVNITASGSGFALFQISYDYNMNVTGPWPLFTLDPQVDKNSNQYHLQLSICTAFAIRNLTNIEESNMAVMEVNLPSGFTADIEALPSIEVSENVQKVHTKNMDTTVVIYFNNLTVNENCPTVSAFQTHKVANQKPVSVVVYDYYDSSRRARIFYKGRSSTICDICEYDKCGNTCAAEAERQRAEAEKQRAEASQDDARSLPVNNAGLLHCNFYFIFLILVCQLLY